MSWRSGVRMFDEMYPIIRANMPNETARREFLARLLPVFLEWDADREELSETSPEVRAVLDTLEGWEVEPNSDE